MTRPILSAFALTLLLVGGWNAAPARAQNEALMDLYGRGVHAYYAGRYNDAFDMLTRAIENDIQDPRAYYFRGIVANATGRPELAKSDWRTGAEMEASGRTNPLIGRSLARIQGSTRLKLEQIRRNAKLDAAQQAATRSQARYGEIQQAEARVLQSPPNAQQAQADQGQEQGQGQADSSDMVTPPVPSEDAMAGSQDNPFQDDLQGGEPTVESSDAFEGAIESARAEAEAANAGAAPAAGAGDAGSPFGEDAGGDANPFGEPAGGEASDPFAPAAGDDNPFGGF